MPMSIEVLLPKDRSISVELRRSKRAKYMSLHANIYGISIVAPTDQSIESISEFVKSKSPWVSKIYEHYSRIREKIGGHIQKDTLLFRGKRFRIRITKDRNQEYAVVSDSLQQITFHVKDKRSYKKYLRKWYGEQTRDILDEKVPLTSRRLSIPYASFSIKQLKSRWGSCTKDGKLSFNLLLSMLPLEVIDYIVVHELVHRIEFNHSKKFWNHVESAVPDYKERRKWLRTFNILIRID
jgi:predicted metal-dependent hydrolase